MFFDFAVSPSNFNKLSKKIIPSARLLPSRLWRSYIENWHESKNALLNIVIFFSAWKNIFIYRNYCKKRPPQTSKNIAIIDVICLIYITNTVNYVIVKFPNYKLDYKSYNNAV